MLSRHLPTARLWLSVLLASTTTANERFPGLKNILSEAEWRRAGLERLSPDQIGVIDAALIRHTSSISAPPSTLATQNIVRPTPAAAETTALAAPIATGPGRDLTPADATPAQTAAAKSRFWEKFGIGGKSDPNDWRAQPPMLAKVTGMRGANGFVLDNGQSWEGQEQIPYEILGQSVIIEARPLGAFALRLNRDSVAVRVRRVR